MVAVAGGGEFEVVAVDGGCACFGVGFDPAPGGEGDEAVGGVVASGGRGFCVGGGGVGGEELRGFADEVLLGLFGEGSGGLDGAAGLVGVPAGEEGDVGLLAGGEDGVGGFGEEVAVDNGAEARGVGTWRGDGLEELLGGKGAKGDEVAGAVGGLSEGYVAGLNCR